MAKGKNQKLKLLYLMKILLEKTDDTHSLTMAEIIKELQAYGVEAERKSIYDDLEALRVFGIDVVKTQDRKKCSYCIGSRDFELAELKLLVDSVQSSKFLTARKSNQLIRKLEMLASDYDGKQLQRQVYVSQRIKTMNESIYYNVDQIHEAINHNVKIEFQYFQWTVDKKMELRHDGDVYCISPWGLSWDDENYYLIGYDSDAGKIKHYRVDKMLKIVTTQIPRDGAENFKKFDTAVYAKKVFGMFDGKEETVKIEFENRYAGVVIDRFGKDVPFHKQDENHFTINVDVCVSGQFFGWIMALGDGVRIVGPSSVVEQMQQEVNRLYSQYCN